MTQKHSVLLSLFLGQICLIILWKGLKQYISPSIHFITNKLSQDKGFKVDYHFVSHLRARKFSHQWHTGFNAAHFVFLVVPVTDTTWKLNFLLVADTGTNPLMKDLHDLFLFSSALFVLTHCWGLQGSYSPHWSHWGDFPVLLSSSVIW